MPQLSTETKVKAQACSDVELSNENTKTTQDSGSIEKKTHKTETFPPKM